MGVSKEQRNAIWAKWEDMTGMQFNDKVRKETERRYSLSAKDTDITQNDYEAGVNKDVNLLRLHIVGKALSPRQPEELTQRKYRRPPDKRLHLVEFIVGQTMAVGLGTKPVIWNIIGRINWKQISAAWNAAYQFDPTTPATLKSRFHHAIIDPDVQQEIIVKKVPMRDLKAENLHGKIKMEWTGRTEQSQSVTVEVPDIQHLRVKEPPINPPTNIPGVPDAETIKKTRAALAAKRKKQKGGKSQ